LEWLYVNGFRRAGDRPGVEHRQRRLQGVVRTHPRRFCQIAGDDKRIVLQPDNAG
jgi:hypothetical protein